MVAICCIFRLPYTAWVYVAGFVLFNPFVPIELDKSVWTIANRTMALIILIGMLDIVMPALLRVKNKSSIKIGQYNMKRKYSLHASRKSVFISILCVILAVSFLWVYVDLSPIIAMPNYEVLQKSFGSGQDMAKLTINNNSGEDYCVRFVGKSTGLTRLEVYVASRASYVGKIPDGLYYVRIARGDNWYGRDKYFGKKTSYYELSSLSEAEYKWDKKITVTFDENDSWLKIARKISRRIYLK
jgi:hypothetical protein